MQAFRTSARVRASRSRRISGSIIATLAAAGLALLACTPEPPPAFARKALAITTGTAAFQDGVAPSAAYAGTRDTTLVQAQPTAGHGAETTVRADADNPSGSGQDLVALLAWDVQGVPAGAQVVAARVVVQVADASSGTWALHAVLRPWSEPQASWNAAATGQAWQLAGAAGAVDRGAVLGTILASATGRRSFALGPAGIAAVQQWLDDPTTNHGLLVTGPSSNGIDLVSREGAAASRPRLEIDWQLGGGPVPIPGVLVQAGATWKYRDNGQNPGTGWQSLTYDDAGWLSGPAQLGYGDGDEAKVIGFGPSSSSKYITSWFRHTFTVDAPAAWQTLTVRLERDDGAAVYLNGTEILRSNLPSGTLLPGTLASSNSDDGVWFEAVVAPALLQGGPNVLAVEVHQRSGSSSDLSFDLALTGTLLPGPLCVDGGCDDGNVCTADACDPEKGCQHAPFPAPACSDGNGCTVDDQCVAGSCLGTPSGCDDGDACTADACSAAAGCQHSTMNCDDFDPCTEDSCAPADGCTYAHIEDCAIEPPEPTLVPLGATWRYKVTNTDQGTTWRQVDFSDTSWSSGKAKLGYGEGDEATVISYGSSSSSKYITTYFRLAFDVANPAIYPPLTLSLWRDDGAVVYLNGTEVMRSNLPDGAISWSTKAVIATDADAAVQGEVSSTLLKTGKNVLAVEVHQSGPTSSDMGMDAELFVGCQASQTVETLCNGRDDDCDGLTDVLLAFAANACTTSAKGACSQGFAVCMDTQRTCLTPPPVAEVANDRDDDCDGLTDNVPASAVLPVRVRVLLPPTLGMELVDGMVELLEVIGVPYKAVASSSQISADWSAAFGELSSFPVAIIPGPFGSSGLSSTQLGQLQSWVQAGGVLILFRPSGGSILGLAGATSATSRTDHTSVRVSATVPAALYLDSLEERDILVAEVPPARSAAYTYGLASGAGVEAFATARSASSTFGPTWLRRALGQGAVYTFGFDALDRTEKRCYDDCFDPGRDVMMLLVKAALREGTRGHYVRKHTVPGVQAGVLMLTHDVDATKAWQSDPIRGEPGVLQMAKMEAAEGVRGSFFMTTDPDYYVPQVMQDLCVLGVCPLGGHSIKHLDMTTLPVGDCNTTVAKYNPDNATLCGEIVTNRERVLSEMPAGTKMVAWRSPFLMVHDDLYDVLADEGYLYDASMAIGDVRTNFPMMVERFPYKQTVFRGNDMVSFPLVQGDSLRVANKTNKIATWTQGLFGNIANGAWNTLLVHPSAGDGLPETFFVKIAAVREFIQFVKPLDVFFGTVPELGAFWHARDRVRLTASWDPAQGYSGTIQVGSLPAPGFSLEFGDDLATFSCPEAGPFTLRDNRLVFTNPLPAGKLLSFSATAK